MSLAELSLDRWRAADAAAVRQIAREAAGQAAGRVSRVEMIEHLGGGFHRVLIERDGQEFALIPGGTVRLGLDLDAWRPTPEQEADYAESVSGGFGYGDDLRAHLARVLSPPRTATVPTVLMAIKDEILDESPADVPAVLAERGLRMPSPDEWEHACGAGATTLFRWGDHCPLDRMPDDPDGGPHEHPNAFGLRIAYDTYRAELSTDRTAVHGGDGGESIWGGYGHLLGWLPLATANRNPSMAEFVYGPEDKDLTDTYSVRPVLPLS
ncbi:hypothetical protein ACQEU3_40450 [Spirillospora sp. CA-253888]